MDKYYGDLARFMLVYAEVKNGGNILTMGAFKELINFYSNLRDFKSGDFVFKNVCEK